MALPPIIANNPLLKFFKTGQDSAPKNPETPSAPANRSLRDVVEISEAARQRLKGVGTLSGEDPAKIRTVAGEARDALAKNAVTLGLDPAHSE